MEELRKGKRRQTKVDAGEGAAIGAILFSIFIFFVFKIFDVYSDEFQKEIDMAEAYNDHWGLE